MKVEVISYAMTAQILAGVLAGQIIGAVLILWGFSARFPAIRKPRKP